MKVGWYVDLADNNRLKFRGSVDPADILRLRLDGLDRMVVESPIEKASDLFQTLQILFFRMERQARMRGSVGIPTSEASE